MGWRQTKFSPPDEANKLPEGQFWWVHQWNYSTDVIQAVVTFDQLGLNHWHELTHCYQGLGWKLTDRTICQEESDGGAAPWEYVVARFSRNGGEIAILVFSTFYEDGSPTEALRIGIDKDWDKQADALTTLLNRISHSESDGAKHSRALQNQAFAVVTEATAKDAELRLIELHLASRTRFRAHWLQKTTAVQNAPSELAR
jgi:hypothetical protein